MPRLAMSCSNEGIDKGLRYRGRVFVEVERGKGELVHGQTLRVGLMLIAALACCAGHCWKTDMSATHVACMWPRRYTFYTTPFAWSSPASFPTHLCQLVGVPQQGSEGRLQRRQAGGQRGAGPAVARQADQGHTGGTPVCFWAGAEGGGLCNEDRDLAWGVAGAVNTAHSAAMSTAAVCEDWSECQYGHELLFCKQRKESRAVMSYWAHNSAALT